MGLGERKNPFSHSHVEGLNDARTKLAEFFSILPVTRRIGSWFSIQKEGLTL
jgi:hypothetical protein